MAAKKKTTNARPRSSLLTKLVIVALLAAIGWKLYDLRSQVAQAETDFAQNIRRIVAQFNLAARRVGISRRTAETAERHYDVARRLYVMGKNTVLELNTALSEKDSARQAAMSALENYWSLYFTLRSLTLYDFEKNREIEAELTY